MIEEDLLLKVQYKWVKDILERMNEIVKSKQTDSEKVQQLEYLIKQGLKAERTDD